MFLRECRPRVKDCVLAAIASRCPFSCANAGRASGTASSLPLHPAQRLFFLVVSPVIFENQRPATHPLARPAFDLFRPLTPPATHRLAAAFSIEAGSKWDGEVQVRVRPPSSVQRNVLRWARASWHLA